MARAERFFVRYGASEEAVGLLVVGRGAVVADVVQVDGEFGGVERFAFAEILAGRDDFVPGFEGHKLESESFLAGEDAVNPALFVRAAGVEGGEGLSEGPEAGVVSCAVIDEEAFEGFAAAGGEENHALVDAVEHGCANLLDLGFAKGRFAVVGLPGWL